MKAEELARKLIGDERPEFLSAVMAQANFQVKVFNPDTHIWEPVTGILIDIETKTIRLYGERA